MKRRAFNLTVFCGAMVVLLGAVAWNAFSQPRWYRSEGRVMLDPSVDFQVEVGALKAEDIVRRVVERVMREDAEEFWAGYGLKVGTGASVVERLIRRDQDMAFDAVARTIDVGYRHCEPEVASRVAGYFVHEVIGRGARRRIDEQMKVVEALVPVAKQQEMKVERMRQALSAFREAPEVEGRTAGETEREMEENLRVGQQALDSLMSRIRDSSMMAGPVAATFHIIGKPRASASKDYLPGPIIRSLAWGGLAAGMIATALGFVFKRPEGESDCARVWLRAIREEVRRPIRRAEVFVFGTVVLVGVTLAVLHALAQPRIYQSSVTVEVSEDAKDYGWDEWSVSDLRGWMPMITQQVVRQFTRRYNAEPLLGIKVAEREADWRAVEASIRGGLKVVGRPAENTLEISYRHSDFKVSGDVAEAFGRAYEAFPRWRENENPEAVRRRWAKVRSPKMGLEPQPIRVARSGWATTNDYLRAPIVLWICAGVVAAVGCGVLAFFGWRLIGRALWAGVRRARFS